MKSRHRLLCGDSTDAACVDRVMGGETADACVTDPPYGVGLGYDAHDDGDGERYWRLMREFFDLAASVSGVVIATVGHKHNTEWFRRFNPSTFCVWFDTMKQSPHPAAYLCKSELVLIFGKVPERWAWDTWQINSIRGDGLREYHPCPKPVALWAAILKPEAYRLIYEPFSGSGTTIIASEQLQRRCFAIEISPAYCDVAVARFEKLTGEKAVRADG